MGAIAESWSTSTGVINTVLAEEANRIGADVHKQILHTSPWIDLIKKASFPDGMGYQLTSLIYERAIPTVATDGAAEAGNANWINVGTPNASSNAFGSSKIQGLQPLEDAMTETADPSTGTTYVSIAKMLKEYTMKRISIESPRISLEDLRFAAHRGEQLKAVTDLLAGSSKHIWENRNRAEFERIAANLVLCENTGTTIKSTAAVDSGDGDTTANENFEGLSLSHSSPGVVASAVNIENTTNATETTNASEALANISNGILDKVYYNLIRKGAGTGAYGRENGRPVFGLVCSSEASYQLQTEAGFRDDVRYNNAKVSDLIAPLGIEKSFRGFYHLIDDMAPRFSIADTGVTSPISPYTLDAGVVTMNGSYDTADYEAAYIIHPDVYHSLIPAPFSVGAGIKFDPLTYSGDFKWTNILNAADNPDGTVGYFRGVLASASKPIKTDFGYVLLFKRTSTTPAA